MFRPSTTLSTTLGTTRTICEWVNHSYEVMKLLRRFCFRQIIQLLINYNNMVGVKQHGHRANLATVLAALLPAVLATPATVLAKGLATVLAAAVPLSIP